MPVVLSPTGEIDTRVFTVDGDDGLPALCLFSSASALEAFLPGDPLGLFIMVHGVAILSWLADHADEVGQVVFDPVGTSRTLPTAVLVSAISDGEQDALIRVVGLNPTEGRLLCEARNK